MTGRPLDLHASGVWRAAGLPRVALRPLIASTLGGQATTSPTPCRRRGPVGAAPVSTSWSATSAGSSKPRQFHGEGYRKAWAKLRVAGIRTAPERVRPVDATSCGPPGPAPPWARRTARRHTTARSRRRSARCDVGHGHDVATLTVGEGTAYVFVAVDHCTDRVHRSPCGQAWDRPILRGARADSPGRPRTLRGDWRRRRPRAASASRPRVELSRGRLSTGGRVLRHRESSPSFVREPEGNGWSRSASSAR